MRFCLTRLTDTQTQQLIIQCTRPSETTKSELTSGDAIMILPSSQRVTKQPVTKRSQETVKFQKKGKQVPSKSVVSQDYQNSNSSDTYFEEQFIQRIILPKTDKRIFDDFKNMLMSYEQGGMIRGRVSNNRVADQRAQSFLGKILSHSRFVTISEVMGRVCWFGCFWSLVILL